MQVKFSQLTSQTKNIFFLPEETIKTEEEILLQKEQARQNARDEETTKIKMTIKERDPINKASYNFGAIKEDTSELIRTQTQYSRFAANETEIKMSTNPRRQTDSQGQNIIAQILWGM